MLRPAWIDDDSDIPDPLGHGEAAVQWLRKLLHPKSRLPGRAVQLDRWQERMIRKIYGPRHPDGSRMVRRVVLIVPRGNRKTALCALLTLLHLMGPERAFGQRVYSAASAQEQARELFREASMIIQNDPELRRHLTVTDHTSEVKCPKISSVYKALSGEGKSHHGLTPNVVIADEIHVWQGRPGLLLWEALESAMVKVAETLLIIASTSGRGQDNLAWKHVEYAIRVQKGEIEDPATLPVIFMAEADDDWQDEELWHAVNPGLEHGYPDLDAYRDKAQKALNSPFERDSFLQFNLNRWLDQSTSPFVEMTIWDEGAHEVDLEDLEARQVECWLAVDLSKNEDLTCCVAVFRDGDTYDVHPVFFCPEDNLRTRGEYHGVDYVGWAEQGLIIPTPGNVVDQRAVEEHIRELCARFNVQEIAFDPHIGRLMMASLGDDGFPVAEFRQGWVSMAPAVMELERAILARALRHSGNPILRWNFANIQVETDKAGNRMFHKGKSGNKIDGAVATAMAVARAAAGETQFITSQDWFNEDMLIA
ncbi:terminase large subunit [Xinfangfangia sp. D13-10-4-6]|uniref:terminase large subunit n=1 Tax=Pseudogemmobacter hezensis TaxID=2737662 RepID=UPI00155425F6|nr:terminase TerL endonuclease subunit [Pseudogemmobacter hezensis]NPD14463.1 terminase large subunit [Pseudogemmobacter hezensis]